MPILPQPICSFSLKENGIWNYTAYGVTLHRIIHGFTLYLLNEMIQRWTWLWHTPEHDAPPCQPQSTKTQFVPSLSQLESEVCIFECAIALLSQLKNPNSGWRVAAYCNSGCLHAFWLMPILCLDDIFFLLAIYPFLLFVAPIRVIAEHGSTVENYLVT